MKKSIFAGVAAVAFGCFGAFADLTTPRYFEENFVKMGEEGDHLTSDWVTYGCGGVPSDDALKSFYGTQLSEDTFGAPYSSWVLLNVGDKCYPISCTNFEGGETADEWLITPALTVGDGVAELKFTAFSYTLSMWTQGTSCPYEILVSETGTAKEDFTSVFTGSISPARNETFERTVVVPLTDFGGKTIHIAFVNKGKDVGNVGFSQIEVGNYAFQYQNQTESVAEKGSTVPVTVNVGMKTPVECPGFNSILEFNDKKVEKYYKKALGSRGNSLVFQLIKFDGADEQIDLSAGQSVNYKLTILPDFEGAKPTELTGSVVVPEKYYVSNVVMEELTASGCGWCPRGMGAVDYYKELLPGNEGEGKFIGINVHSNMNYQDPMNKGVEAYVSNSYANNGSTGLPQAAFNRKYKGVDPSRVASFTSARDDMALYKAEITHLLCEENLAIGGHIQVVAEVRAGYTASAKNISAAAVLIENDVQGNESGYTQENYLYNRTYSNSAIQGVPEKYYARFFPGGEFATAEIRFDKMVYQEVARGIWPSFFGQSIQSDWTADVPQTTRLTFQVPENLININNDEQLDKSKFEVAILILDDESGEIVASDVMGLDKFTSAGVGSVEASTSIKVSKDGADVLVSAGEPLDVELFTIDGMKIGSYASAEGLVRVNGADLSGIVIIRANTAGETVARKLVF